MLPVYLASLAFGLVLVGASVFGGTDGEGDGGADADDGHAHGGAHGGGPVSDFLSLRFWTYSLAAFGMTGAALLLLKTPFAVHLSAAAVLGVAVGLGASRVFRSLAGMGTGTLPDSRALEGRDAEVVLALAPERLGKVRVRLADQDCELLARGGDETIARGEKVLVIRVNDGVADVRSAPWKE